MRLKALKLRNFRAYRGDVEIPFEEGLTAFIGRNDAGKSSILDALAIFFDSPLARFDVEDLCVHAEDKEVRIGCVFTDLPDKIVLGASSETSLVDEYLTNADGDLEIHKIFDCSVKNPKPRIVAVARHPSAEGMSDLLYKKNSELKSILKDVGSIEGVDQRSNPALRRAIWQSSNDLKFVESEIELNKEDAKKIWDQLQKHLPLFALFRADRPSTDDDAEVQDPMKVAVRQALAELGEELRDIQDRVQKATLEVAKRTLEKVQELDPVLAKDLSPVFRADPKWDTIFKLALTTEDQIPVNKRGSGFRRLILLGFFRAEAERRLAEEGKGNVIYAIEEPETSQHPRNQQVIIEALKDLAAADGCQVIITTHVPGLAALVPTESLRYLRVTDVGSRVVEAGSDDVFKRIADDLGVIADRRVRVLVCVEGPNDVAFLKAVMKILLNAGDASAIDPDSPEVVFLPLGGSTLRDWVSEHYLRPLNLPEIHIYDRDVDKPPKYETAVRKVNQRGDGSRAFLTQKRAAENYLHKDAIRAVLGVEVDVSDESDVPLEVARAIHERAGSENRWDELPDEKRRKKVGNAKRRLNHEVAPAMTLEMLKERGALDEIREWLRAIKSHLQ